MGAIDQLSRKAGVITGDDVLRLFQYAQEKQFAIPAVVCIPIFSTNTTTVLILIHVERHLFFRRRLYPRGRP